jgi:hypothetical protein
MRESSGPRNGQKGLSDDATAQCGADCSAFTGSGCRTGEGRESPGGLAEAGDHPADLVPLADEVRLDGAKAGLATLGIAERECPAESADSRVGLGYVDPARGRPPKLVSHERRRRTVEAVRQRLGPKQISKRRTCRVLEQPRGSQRYQSKKVDEDRQLLGQMRRVFELHP